MWKWLTSGFILWNASSSVLSSMILWGHRFYGKTSLACLESVQPLHTPCLSILNSRRPFNISLRIGNSLWCRCSILLCHKSHKFPLLCIKAQIGSPYNLYKLPSLTHITWVVYGINFFGLMRTWWFLNSTTKPLSFLTETKRKFLLRLVTKEDIAKI